MQISYLIQQNFIKNKIKKGGGGGGGYKKESKFEDHLKVSIVHQINSSKQGKKEREFVNCWVFFLGKRKKKVKLEAF